MRRNLGNELIVAVVVVVMLVLALAFAMLVTYQPVDEDTVDIAVAQRLTDAEMTGTALTENQLTQQVAATADPDAQSQRC